MASTANTGAQQVATGLGTAAQRATELTNAANQLAVAAGPAVNTLKLAIANLQKTAVGGCPGGGFFGGGDGDAEDPAKSLREYAISLSAKAKEDVIRRIARAVKRLGVSNIDPEGDMDKIVKTLIETVPNPRSATKPKTIDAAPDKQKQLCAAIAKVLNDEFSPGASRPSEMFIDTSLGPGAVCQATSEWVHSFASGVHTEFLAVYASVRNALQQITIFDQIMAASWRKIQAKIDESRDDHLKRELDVLTDLYNRAQGERRRQEELLKNILHVQLAPAMEELRIALQDESSHNAIIKSLNGGLGSKELSDSIALALTGLGSVANIANRVNKALKQVGESVRSYLDSKDFASFQKALDKKIESGQISVDDLSAFLSATEILRYAFAQKDEASFREELEGEKTATGGGDLTPMAMRLDQSAKERKLIISDFAGRMSRHYDGLLAAIQEIAPKLGKEIPIGVKTDALRDGLSRLSDMRTQSQRLELALIGRFVDADARRRKEQFVATLQVVANACTDIMGLEMYRASSASFARLRAAIEGIIKTIDYFSDVITKKFGGAEPSDEDEAADISGGRRGGGIEDTVLPEIARSGLNLTEAVNLFAYNYYTAGIFENLSKTSKELEKYGEKYEELLGDAVAARLFNLEKERKAIIDRLDATTRGAATPGVPNWLPQGAAPTQDQLKRLAAVKQWVEDEYKIKKEFYNVLQAVDIYMKVFTAAIAKDPEAVRDIKKILDGVQSISRWYSETTGNSIWKAFDQMGATDFNGAVATNVAGHKSIERAANSQAHYYDHAQAAADASFGVPQIGVQPTGNPNDPAAAAKRSVAEAVDFYQGLKNLINAFARIGSKFGGQDIRTSIFMPTSKIFKVLTDYIKQSALSINAGISDAQPAPLVLNKIGDIQPVATAVGAYEVYFGSTTDTGIVGNYEIEDRYMAIMLKAMVAKVFTVLGVYDMFERTTPLAALNPTRMIVGGGPADEEVEAIEGAAELYFRLPRLAEFYRSILGWGEKDGVAGDLKIAMVPELEGTFAGLIRLIFQKVVSPETGDYSESEMLQLVSEINRIYQVFSSKEPGRATRAALLAFVAEINRRYGIIRRQDMKDYWSIANLDRSSQGPGGLINDTNFSVLPDEDVAEIAERRAPSDRYAIPALMSQFGIGSAGAGEPFKGRTQLDTLGNGARKMLHDFRATLDAKLASAGKDAYGVRKYGLLIQQAENEMRSAASRDGKFKIACRLIQGANIVGIDASKAFMFHETVVVGLNMLSAIESTLRNFSDAIDAMNPATIEAAIMDAVYANATGQQLSNQDQFNAKARTGGLPNTRADFVALIQGRVAKCAGQMGKFSADMGAAVPRFDNYLMDESSGYAGRCGIQLAVTAGNVYAFLANEENDFSGLAPPPKLANGARLSQFINSELADVKKAFPANADQGVRFFRAARVAARALVNSGKIMRDFVELVFDIASGSQGLIEVQYVQGNRPGIQLGFSKLRGLAESILSDVKSYFEQFRPFLSKETISRYEGGTNPDANPGSIFWLEKHLVDGIFRSTTASGDTSRSLEGLSRRVNLVLQGLLRETQVPLVYLTRPALMGNAAQRAEVLDGPGPPAAPISQGVVTASKTEWYGQTFSGLVFYNATGTSAGAAEYTSNTGVGTARALDDNDYKLSANIAKDSANARPLAANTGRYPIYDSDPAGFPEQRGLLFSFNQILARYLLTLTDSAAGNRIYIRFIDALANGTLSQSVMAPDGNAFPDIATSTTVFGMRSDPKPNAILFQSLAYILQRFIKDANPNNQIPTHIVATLTDLPLYMKESLRANLPSLAKLFDTLASKAEFIKQLMQKLPSLNLVRPSQAGLANVANNNAGIVAGDKIVTAAGTVIRQGSNGFTSRAVEALEEFAPPLTSDQMRARLVGIIDAIGAACFTASDSARAVLKELGDVPVFLQTQESSIEQYKMRYGKLPLMPLSLSLWFLSDIQVSPASGYGYKDPRVFPSKALGSPDFKVLYGCRQIVAQTAPIGFEQMPGAKALLDAYNGVSAKREQVDPSRYLRFAQNVVSGLRFLVEARSFKSAIATSDRLPVDSLIRGPDVPVGSLMRGPEDGISNYIPGAPAKGSAVFALARPPVEAQTIANIVESSNQEEEMGKISDRVGGTTSSVENRRDMEQIFNLIDMNIIPINVHALMSSIPLANLYNYEYTFEQMVASMFGEQSSVFALPVDRVKNTRQMFLKLLSNPYMNISTEQYGSDSTAMGSAGFVHRIFRGDNSIAPDRPKFLSDQLFNKALFGSVYLNRADYDEGGPLVGIGAARGRDAAIGPAQTALQMLTSAQADIRAAAAKLKIGAATYATAAGVRTAADRTNADTAITGDLAGRLPVLRRTFTQAAGQFNPTTPLAAALRGLADRVDTTRAPAIAGGLAALLSAFIALGANTAARIADPGFDAAVVAIENQLVDIVTAGTLANVLDAQMNPAGANTVRALAQIEAETRGAVPTGAISSRPRASTNLTYLAPSSDPEKPEQLIVEVPVGNRKDSLEAIGKARFDTRFVRNYFFITNLVRVMRMKLNRELTQSRNVLVVSHMAVAPGLTEFGTDSFTPNEILDDAPVGYSSRFSDRDPSLI